MAELIAEAYAAAANDSAANDSAPKVPGRGDAGPEDGDADPGSGLRIRPPRTGRAADDAVRRMAGGALDDARRRGTRRTAGEPFTVLVTVDVATLARALGLDDANAALDADPLYRLGSATFTRSGKRLSDAELRRLLPDAVLQVLVTADGLPLWMGDEERFANRHQRRALLVRGRGHCEVPGCTNGSVLRAHHVVEACERGPTCLCNLLHPCAPHHRQLHAEGWRIETEPGSQRFTLYAADGRCLGSTHPDGRPPDLDGPRRAPPRSRPPLVASDATAKTGGGEPLTRYAVDVFLSELLRS